MQVFSNNAATTLASQLSAVATSMTVTASAGFASIASPQFELITLEAAPAAREIVKVTARSGNVWTIARAQEGTTAAAWPAGSKAEARVTAGTMTGMVQASVESIAIGTGAVAPGVKAVALGAYSEAHGEESCCINGLAAFAGLSITSKGYFSIPEDNWNDQYENWSAGTQSVFATPYLDLASPPAWQASVQYTHGQVVAPTTGGAVQYRVWCSYADETLLHVTPTSEASEPTWPGSGGSESINSTDNAEWIGIDLDAGYETETFPPWLEFWPSEIAFICQEYAATTGTPTVSIGTPSAPTLILNAATVGVTAVGQVFRFTLPNPCPRIPEGESIVVTLEGAASAGQMVGRFLFTGAFVATRSRT